MSLTESEVDDDVILRKELWNVAIGIGEIRRGGSLCTC